MIAMISTDEYKELIEAQKKAEIYQKAYHQSKTELQRVKEEINSLLLTITNRAVVPAYSNNDFRLYEIADADVLAKYINDNFVENGKLNLKEIEE